MSLALSDSIWVRPAEWGVQTSLDALIFGPTTSLHGPASRLALRPDEKHAFYEASLVNVGLRGLNKVRVSLETLNSSESPYSIEQRILDAVGLLQNNQSPLHFCHVLSHLAPGQEPLILFNQKQGELPPCIARRDWTDATRSPDNLLPLQAAEQCLLDSDQAGPMPTSAALMAYILATEAALAAKIVVEDEGGHLTPNREAWDFEPGAVLAGVSFPFEFDVPSQGTRTATTYEYDWWVYPRADCPSVDSAGYFFPGEGRSDSTVERPSGGWDHAVPVNFETAQSRPSFRVQARPVRISTRFLWALSIRAAEGDPIKASPEGSLRIAHLDYLADLFCVMDLQSLAALLLRKRPPSMPRSYAAETLARIEYIEANPSRDSAERIFPSIQAPSGLKGRAGASTSRFGDGSGNDTAFNAVSLKMSHLLDDVWHAHQDIPLFLEERLRESHVCLSDLLGGWPRVVSGLSEPHREQAARLLERKAGLTEHLLRLSDEEAQAPCFGAGTG